ncbi:hypothetical protein JKP88DRAFT_156886 [Tribonema minus]|uniref:GIY-YIG domain-containing protein n=1 Tax=Tribonema minus TaxID=303371 RepID=A0A836CIF4_9STRA|nr:hypothetical protein JKP88DRAFT_156886 [Tribonema minus]
MTHFCYTIVNEQGRTYVGYTVLPKRRLRQHNGVITGGARSTAGKGPWRFAFVLTSESFDSHKGLSCEWHLKRPNGRRSRCRPGVQGRIDLLSKVVCHHKFCTCAFRIYASIEHFEAIASACGNCANVTFFSVTISMHWLRLCSINAIYYIGSV